jgi:hypothetical protein
VTEGQKLNKGGVSLNISRATKSRVSWKGPVTRMKNMGKEGEILIENTKRRNSF